MSYILIKELLKLIEEFEAELVKNTTSKYEKSLDGFLEYVKDSRE